MNRRTSRLPQRRPIPRRRQRLNPLDLTISAGRLPLPAQAGAQAEAVPQISDGTPACYTIGFTASGTSRPPMSQRAQSFQRLFGYELKATGA